jgi:hypothetical protein
MKLDYKLFKGASIQFNDIDKAEELAAEVAAMPAIKQVWPVRKYHVPEHTVHWVSGDSVSDAEALKRQTENDTFSPHLMTQVNLLREQGIVGDGIKIAVIDTGVSDLLRGQDYGRPCTCCHATGDSPD